MKKNPTKKGGGSCLQVSSSFFCLPFSALVFLLSLCFLISWSLFSKFAHQMKSSAFIYTQLLSLKNDREREIRVPIPDPSKISMCFLTVSSRPCLETSPHSILRTPFAGHCLGALWGGKQCPAQLSEGVSHVFRTLSGSTPLPILQTPSAGHCLDTHGIFSALGKWGRAQMGSDGFNRILTGFFPDFTF